MIVPVHLCNHCRGGGCATTETENSRARSMCPNFNLKFQSISSETILKQYFILLLAVSCDHFRPMQLFTGMFPSRICIFYQKENALLKYYIISLIIVIIIQNIVNVK